MANVSSVFTIYLPILLYPNLSPREGQAIEPKPQGPAANEENGRYPWGQSDQNRGLWRVKEQAKHQCQPPSCPSERVS